MATIAGEEPLASRDQNHVWHSSAPNTVLEAAQRGDSAEEWRSWSQHVQNRSTPRGLSELLQSQGSPLEWCLPSDARLGELGALGARLRKVKAGTIDSGIGEAIEQWLQTSEHFGSSRDHAIESLAWAHTLVNLIPFVDSRRWWALLEHLVQTAHEASAIDVDAMPVTHQWLAAELPATLAYLFPEIESCRRLAKPAADAFDRGMSDLLDGEGLVHAKHLDVFRTLLACWMRGRELLRHAPHGGWSSQVEEQFQWVARQTYRLMRRDGSQSLSVGREGNWNEDLFRTVAKSLASEQDRDLAELLIQPKGKDKKRLQHWNAADPSVHSEWAEFGMLRTDWSPNSPRMSVNYHEPITQLELTTGRDILWSGNWLFEIELNGKPASIDGAWEEVCWICDEDAVYLEIEAKFTEGIRIQRQVLLARKDNFALLADAVMSSDSGELKYRATLPLGPGLSFVPSEESREGFLEGRKYRGLVMPLALSEWRRDRRFGEIQEKDGHLELTQQVAGKNLFAPIWIDLDRRRMMKQCTWRHLTVAQTRSVVPSDTAVGFRVQSGKQQWLIYRSLGSPANRTVLGHNLNTEYLVARFNSDGTVQALIEIE